MVYTAQIQKAKVKLWLWKSSPAGIETSVTDLLGGERVLGSSITSRLGLARATREGLPAETARRLLAVFADIFVDFYMDEVSFWYPVRSPNDSMFGPIALVWRSLMLDAESAGTDIGNRLTPEDSDLVVRVATVLARAIDVLGKKARAGDSRDRAMAAVCWLTRSSAALGDQVPMSLLDTFAGTREVEAALDRFESGGKS